MTWIVFLGDFLNNFFNPFRLIFYVLNVLIAIIFVLLIFSDKGIKQNDKLEKLVSESSIRYNKTLKEYNDLKLKIGLFEDNQYYQVKVIHEEIGYINESEKIYIFK